MYEYVWRVLKHEGGYSDDLNDRGGKTSYGITWRTYKEYCKRIGSTPSNGHHMNLTSEEVLSIYLVLFIDPYRIEGYENEWTREAMFSSVIMHGGPAAASLAQKSVNKISVHKIKVDGIAGDKTHEAINSIQSRKFVNKLTAERIIFVDRLVQRTVNKGDYSQVNFLVGWHKRFLRFISTETVELP